MVQMHPLLLTMLWEQQPGTFFKVLKASKNSPLIPCVQWHAPSATPTQPHPICPRGAGSEEL